MKTKRTIASVLLAMAAAATMLIAGNGPAGATEPASGEALDEVLSAYPDAQRLSDGSYELQPGVRLELVASAPDGGAGVTEWPSGCLDGSYCIFRDMEFGYLLVRIPPCTYVDLGPLSNQASSMHNAHNSLRAYFWDDDTGTSGSMSPNSYWRDMRKDIAPDGRSWNDRIDSIYLSC